MRIFLNICLLWLCLLGPAQALEGVTVTGVSPAAALKLGLGRPLAGVEIEALGTSWRTVSRPDGSFSLPDLPAGEFTLVSRKPGYLEARLKVRSPGSCQVILNPANISIMGDYALGSGAVYVAFQKKPVNDNKIEASPYSDTARKAVAAGVKLEEYWSNRFELPAMPRGPGMAHLMNQITSLDNFVMAFPPDSPPQTGFLPLADEPYWMAFSPDGALLYTSLAAQVVQVMDARQNHRLLANLPMPGAVSDLRLSQDGRLVLASVMGSPHGVALIESSSGRKLGFLVTESAPRAAVLAGNRLFICCEDQRHQGRVEAYEVGSGRKLGGCRVGNQPVHMAATPDCSRLLVACRGQAGVSLVDTLNIREIQRIPCGISPERVVVRPDGKYCFVACKQDNKVARIDLERLALAGHTEVAREPLGLAFAADGRRCYVACRRDGCVQTLDGESGQLLHTTLPQPHAVPFGVILHP